LSTWAPHAHDSEKQQYFWPSACDDLYRDVKIPPPILGEPSFFGSLPEFVKKSMNRERWFWRFDTPEKYQEMVKGYYRMISGVDMALGRLLTELKRMDRHKDTIIMLMSDNGYFLGERGFAGKWTMHDLSIRVPLIIYDPRMAEPASGADLYGYLHGCGVPEDEDRRSCNEQSLFKLVYLAAESIS
jgi:arylsulfatase A-like enzyme